MLATPRWPLGGGQSTKGPARWRACLEAGDHPAEPGTSAGPGETFAAPGSEPREEGDAAPDVQLIPKIFPMGQKPRPAGRGRSLEVGRPEAPPLRRRPPQRAAGRASRRSLRASPPDRVLHGLLPQSLRGGRAGLSRAAPLSQARRGGARQWARRFEPQVMKTSSRPWASCAAPGSRKMWSRVPAENICFFVPVAVA